MRILIFCGSRKALERYDMIPDCTILAPYVFPPERRMEILQAWTQRPGAILAVGKQMATGWRAPADTLVLFDASWPHGPDDPWTIQALARVSDQIPIRDIPRIAPQ